MRDARTVTFERWNFTAAIPVGWSERASDAAPLPEGFTAPKRLFAADNDGCYAAYAEFHTIMHNNEYPQTAYSTDLRKDSMFHAKLERRIPPSHGTTGSVRAKDSLYEPYEVALAYWPLYYDNGSGGATNNVWVLFTASSAPISLQCQTRFLELLVSLAPIYGNHALTRNDNGILTIEQSSARGAELLFQSEGGTRMKVARFDDGLIYKPTLVGDTLYYVGTDGMLRMLALFDTHEPVMIALDLPDGDLVNDFYVYDTTLYYLAGAWCQNYKATCDLSLYSYDIGTGDHKLLAEGIASRVIVGFSDELDALYLAYTEGDAGYSWGSYSRYNAEDGRVEVRYEYSVDTNDAEAYEEHVAQVREVREVSRTYPSETSLRVREGAFSAGPERVEGVVSERLPIVFVNSGPDEE